MANVTLKAGASALGIESKSRRLGLVTPSNFDRYIAEGSVNVDLPITERASAIGRLTANVNGGLRYLDDFGTLTSVGAGLNWSPATRLNLLAELDPRGRRAVAAAARRSVARDRPACPSSTRAMA